MDLQKNKEESPLTSDDLILIESLVNEKIRENKNVSFAVHSREVYKIFIYTVAL